MPRFKPVDDIDKYLNFLTFSPSPEKTGSGSFVRDEIKDGKAFGSVKTFVKNILAEYNDKFGLSSIQMGLKSNRWIVIKAMVLANIVFENQKSVYKKFISIFEKKKAARLRQRNSVKKPASEEQTQALIDFYQKLISYVETYDWTIRRLALHQETQETEEKLLQELINEYVDITHQDKCHSSESFQIKEYLQDVRNKMNPEADSQKYQVSISNMSGQSQTPSSQSSLF